MLSTDYTDFRRLDNANLAVAHVKAVLEELRQMKMHLAVPTNSISAFARPFLDRHLPRAAEKLRVAPDGCFVIEDSLFDIAASEAAHMRVAAIPDRCFVDPRAYEKQGDKSGIFSGTDICEGRSPKMS